MAKFKLEIIPEWRDAYKWVSINCMVVAAALQATWVSLPANLVSKVPEPYVHLVTMGILVLGIIGRILKQGDANVSNTEDAGTAVLAGDAAGGAGGDRVAKRAPQRKSGVQGKKPKRKN